MKYLKKLERHVATSTVEAQAILRMKELFKPSRFRPNISKTTAQRSGIRWSGVAWVFPQRRESARRLRQMGRA